MTTIPLCVDILILQGCTLNTPIALTDPVTGELIDFTGMSLELQGRLNINSTTAFIDLSTGNGGIAIVNETIQVWQNGVVVSVPINLRLLMDAADTAALAVACGVYDMIATDSTQSPANVSRIMQGNISVSRQVTQP